LPFGLTRKWEARVGAPLRARLAPVTAALKENWGRAAAAARPVLTLGGRCCAGGGGGGGGGAPAGGGGGGGGAVALTALPAAADAGEGMAAGRNTDRGRGEPAGEARV
jgi:hypothetical protein